MTSSASDTGWAKSITPKSLIAVLIFLTCLNLYLIIPKRNYGKLPQLRNVVSTAYCPKNPVSYQSSHQPSNAVDTDTLFSVLKHITKAHRHARSSLVLMELSLAHEKLFSHFTNLTNKLASEKKLLLENNVYLNPRSSLNTNQQLDVCPDQWQNVSKWYYAGGHFYGGYFQNCSGKAVAPIESVVTLLLNLDNATHKNTVESVLNGIQKSRFSKIPVVITTFNPAASHWSFPHASDGQITLLHNSYKQTLGQRMQDAVSKISTKYVLVGRAMEYADEKFSVDRLLMMLSFINADFVAGSHRSHDGHLEIGCYQMAVKNYTMTLVSGYDLSYNSCMYCDYVSGPFAARTSLLRDLVDPQLNGESVFADIWFRQRDKAKIINCPDVMFHTKTIGITNSSKLQWLDFVQKHKLSRLHLPFGTLTFSCGESHIKCTRAKKGMILPLCCHNILTKGLIELAKSFDQAAIHYELSAGSNLGAVKLGTTLPFEIDHDIHMQARNWTELSKVNQQLTAAGYGNHGIVKAFKHTCLDRMNQNRSRLDLYCGQFNFFPHPAYMIETMGWNIIQNELVMGGHGLNFTRINFAGYWMVVQPNPAHHARNKYGDDMFRHVEHWRNLRFSPYQKYSTSSFSECPVASFHGCLQNNYLEVGNMQFKDTN